MGQYVEVGNYFPCCLKELDSPSAAGSSTQSLEESLMGNETETFVYTQEAEKPTVKLELVVNKGKTPLTKKARKR